MRISTDKDDGAGYSTWEKVKDKDISVTLDGQPFDVALLVSADEEQSELISFGRHASGELLLDYGGHPAKFYTYGAVKIIVADRPYNAADETRKHIDRVRANIEAITADLHQRAQVHDESKFDPIEMDILQKVGELNRREPAPFGTPEYDARKATMGPMLEHHYAANDHHPEHYEFERGGSFVNGVAGMNLMALVEMFANWAAAAADRDPDGTMNLTFACQKYEIPPMLESVFRNTADALGFPHK